MARPKKVVKKQKPEKKTYKFSFNPSKYKAPASSAWLEKIQKDIRSKQSPSNLILGALIVVLLAVLVFNYFSKVTTVSTPSQTDSQTTQQTGSNVQKDNLPGKYTVKDGDTLFTIAQKYYDNGDLFDKIAQANKIDNADDLTVGQVLEIPKLDAQDLSSPSPTPGDSTTPQSKADPTRPVQGGQGGATNQTIWGEAITGNTYTVKDGDWLSKIAGRAYGDIFSFDKIAKANNISDPNLIEPGMVLQIPR